MSKKITTDIVTQIALQRGYILNSTYVKNTIPMEFICSNGHKWVVSLANFRYNECGRCIRDREREKLYNKAKQIIEDSGGIILSTFYVDSETALNFICHCKRKGSLTLNELKSSRGYCPECRYERSSQKLSYNLDYIKELLYSFGCILLSTEYKSNKDHLDYLCNCGEKCSKTLSAIKKSYRCEKCFSKYKSEVRTKPFEYYYPLYHNNSCEIIEIIGDYVGQDTIVKFLCNCGRQDISMIKNFRYSPRCDSCSRELTVNSNRFTFQEVNEFVENNSNCKLLSSEYIKTDLSLLFLCECNNEFTASFSEFKHGNKRQCNTCGIASRSGENSPNWQGGTTSENEKIRHSKEYSIWRTNVFERDSFTCQCCLDSTGGNLQAHHVENFSTNEELRLEMSNGITMCSTCHDFRYLGSFHHKYGTKDNTKEQLIEYIINRRIELGISAEMPFLLCQ